MNRKTVFKWFWAWDFEKEEAWLNEMAQSGWTLDTVGWCTYNFVKTEQGEYAIRLEAKPYDESYLSFMSQTGAEYIGRVVQWIYFRRKTEYGEFDLFSDIDSRIAHLNRIGKILTVVGFANIAIGVNPMNHINWINLLCATLLMYGLGRIHGKKEALEKERFLHE